MSPNRISKTSNLNDTKASKNRDFEILYNALSVGWHLRKILEISPDIIASDTERDRFDLWLQRHKVWTQKKSKVKRK